MRNLKNYEEVKEEESEGDSMKAQHHNYGLSNKLSRILEKNPKEEVLAKLGTNVKEEDPFREEFFEKSEKEEGDWGSDRANYHHRQ